MKKQSKSLLVTGGAGFIGSHLIHHLHKRYPHYRITILDALTYAGSVESLPTFKDDGNLRFILGDIRNEELVDTLVSEHDVVIHLAAETHIPRSINNSLLFVQTDVIGTQVLCHAMTRYLDKLDRFIYISSSEVYGTAQTPFMDETHPLEPKSPYAAAKAGADRLAYSFWATHGLPAVIVRPFNNYGQGQHVEKAIPRFIAHCLMDEPIVLHGSGEQERDWMFVKDHCEALDRLIHVDRERVLGEVINLGSERGTSILEVAKMVRDLTGSTQEIKTAAQRPGTVWRHLADSSKAKKLLDWEATTSLEEGLRKTIDWAKKSPDCWQQQLSNRYVPLTLASGQKELH